ncbi:MAG: aspartate aminotransferase family protein [Bacteroides sp.]|jgi:acetylornithine/succinyldiaminopimelate/putrescine aminotransferase|nr:aspartate aminotransferase family protein [Bacteroides sp.]
MMNNRELFYRFLGQTSSFPLGIEIERAEGVYMYGPEGKSYLDLISGISVSSIGHRHPRVVQAIKEQVDHYMHLMVYGEFVQSPQVKLAELLVRHLPENLDNVFLVNSGSEAVEGALKLAKRYTGRTEVISFSNAYHGSTQGSLSVMGNERMKKSFRPLIPDVRILKYNHIQALEEISDRSACVIVETIQGEGGAVVPSEAFMKALRKRCHETGALLILDEIQAGLGRTGKLWAFEYFGIVPDILLLAKGLGGGMPIGAFISSSEIMRSLTYSPVLGHITTFGGNAVCAAAALATLEVITENKLWEGVEVKEKLFRANLKHPSIRGIHGKGLMLALEFDSFEKNKEVIDRCLDMGVLTDWFLFAEHCLRIAPPLTINEKQIHEACEVILKALK